MNESGWRPINTVPDCARVELFLQRGEKGNGEIAIGMVIRDSQGKIDGFWSWGGPNSGNDFNEIPTHWRYLRAGPDGQFYGEPPQPHKTEKEI